MEVEIDMSSSSGCKISRLKCEFRRKNSFPKKKFNTHDLKMRNSLKCVLKYVIGFYEKMFISDLGISYQEALLEKQEVNCKELESPKNQRYHASSNKL